MDAKTRQAWEYIQVLDDYSKQWDKPLGDLIYQLIDNMTEYQEKQNFITGIQKLQKKGWLTGEIDYSEILDNSNDEFELDDEEEKRANTNDISINPNYRKWYLIHFKWGSNNPKMDANPQSVGMISRVNKIINRFIAIVAPIASINVIVDFVRNILQLFNVIHQK